MKMQFRVIRNRTFPVFAAWFIGLVCGCAPQHVDQPRALILSAGWKLQDVAKVSQSGDIISSPGFDSSNWLGATVPGTVLTSLVNDGIYPDPLYGENNRPDKIPESLSRTSYWYRNVFPIPSHYTGRRMWLKFDGINYKADVWVNGVNIGRIDGAFARGEFDISPQVKSGSDAIVAIQIFPPPHPGDHAEKTVKSGTGPNGGILTEDGPTFLCSLGWDWIPTIRDRNIGIWQKASLDTSGPVVLHDPMVSSELQMPQLDSAELTLEVIAENLTDQPQYGILNGKFDDISFCHAVWLKAREKRVVRLRSVGVPQLHLKNPRLWWPNGYGAPGLYKMHLSYDIAGNSSDVCDFKFGIRKITYQLPGSDNLGLSVNGVPVMCKGGDWGMDEAMKRIGRDRLEAQIRMHQQANYTMIRNWVGQSTSEDFYDLCDQYGIMVWDEFFQPNPSDGPNPNDTDMYLANVREKVLRFRNHPSIALWCGRNEGNPPPVVDAGIRKIMAELNPQRLYQPSSRDGRGVRSGGPYSWRAPRQFYTFAAAEAFKTEIGSVSIPTLQAIQAMMPQKDWDTFNDDWAEHDLTRGAQEGRGGPMYPDMIAQRYGPVANLADFVRKSQLANYEAYRAMYEGRFAKLFKPTTGVITWMSNPAQPSMVWQLYSHDLEPNSSLFAVAKACEPIHIQMNQNDFRLMVINNTPRTLENYSATARVFNIDGILRNMQCIAVSAPASAATELGRIEFSEDLSPVHFVKLELHDRDGHLVSDSFYWRARPEHQDDFTSLNSLPQVTLEKRITRHDADGKILMDVSLFNPTKSVALMAHVQLRRQQSGQRVLPVYYSDNYVSLLPGESKTISIEAATKDLGNEQPVVKLDGWNIASGNEPSEKLQN